MNRGPALKQSKPPSAEVQRLTVRDLLNFFDSYEIWRRIEGYSDYEVSSWGNVRGKHVNILKPACSRKYLHVSLSQDGKITNMRVHKLVAAAFLGAQPFDGAVVAHNDGDSSNNNVSNLRWTTNLDNQADADHHGTRLKGSAIHLAVLREEQIPSIRKRALSGEIYKNIAEDYGVSISTISLIKLGRIWRHV